MTNMPKMAVPAMNAPRPAEFSCAACDQPSLRLSPTAWAKLDYLRDCGPSEVAGFGIATQDDPLCVVDVKLVRQQATPVRVQLDDVAVADFFQRQVECNKTRKQPARIYLATHPSDSAAPTRGDEEAFLRLFGRSDWAVLLILARAGRTYARLQYFAGPRGQVVLPVEIDYGREFSGSNHSAWERDYQADVEVLVTDDARDAGPDWEEQARCDESHQRPSGRNTSPDPLWDTPF